MPSFIAPGKRKGGEGKVLLYLAGTISVKERRKGAGFPVVYPAGREKRKRRDVPVRNLMHRAGKKKSRKSQAHRSREGKKVRPNRYMRRAAEKGEKQVAARAGEEGGKRDSFIAFPRRGKERKRKRSMV